MINFLGRGSNCINSGGEKIFPEEGRTRIARDPAILDALVVGIDDERWGQKVAAVVSLRDRHDAPEPAAIADFIKTRLAAYKTPPDDRLGRHDPAVGGRKARLCLGQANR